MVINSKFQLGQVVESDFNGEVEGVDVVVTKRLWVIGVKAEFVDGSGIYKVAYDLTDRNPSWRGRGKEYRLWSEALRELEPVVAAAVDSQPEPQMGQSAIRELLERYKLGTPIAPCIEPGYPVQQYAEEVPEVWTTTTIAGRSAAGSGNAHTTPVAPLV